MRIGFVSRRYLPAISGMSIYAANLLRELVGAGHDHCMISQYRGDALGSQVYGGGPPPPVEGVRVIGLEQLGEQGGGDFERHIAAMVETIVAQHRRQPFDVLHAQIWLSDRLGDLARIAADRVAEPVFHSGRRWPLGG